MKKYVIVTDSCSDLEKVDRERYNIEYLKLHYAVNGEQYDADLDWQGLSFEEFYGIMRKGDRIITAQINTTEYVMQFEKFLLEGCDILYIGCSSALSGSVKASTVARDELLQRYPDGKIICVDSLNASMGLGMLCIVASKLRDEGKTIEEVATWVEDNRRYVHQEATPEKLIWLKQAGRISASKAFIGGLLNVKPIIISDVNGANVSVEKVKGRTASFERIAQRFKERFVNYPYQMIYFVHGDCIEDVKDLAKEVEKVLPEEAKNIQINIRKLGPAIGASCGPGMIGLYFFGTEETYDGSKE
ncbi:MAG: DegV family protein [Clostridia bacterium]|nr:DegV family protein [Clostridia bacterium]